MLDHSPEIRHVVAPGDALLVADASIPDLAGAATADAVRPFLRRQNAAFAVSK
jgi:hypothetical protein